MSATTDTFSDLTAPTERGEKFITLVLHELNAVEEDSEGRLDIIRKEVKDLEDHSLVQLRHRLEEEFSFLKDKQMTRKFKRYVLPAGALLLYATYPTLLAPGMESLLSAVAIAQSSLGLISLRYRPKGSTKSRLERAEALVMLLREEKEQRTQDRDAAKLNQLHKDLARVHARKRQRMADQRPYSKYENRLREFEYDKFMHQKMMDKEMSYWKNLSK